MKTFNLPDLGEGLTEGEILRWLVAEGDEITLNQPIVEVETAKAAVEVPSPYAGRVATLHHEEGATVDVGAPLISIDVDGTGDGTPSDGADSADGTPSDGSDGADGKPSDGADGADGKPSDARVAAEPAPESEFVPPQASEAGAGEGAGGRQAVLVGYGPRTGAATRRPRKSVAAQAPSSNPAVAEALPPEPGPGAHPVRHGGMEVGRSAAEKLSDAAEVDPVRRRSPDPSAAAHRTGGSALAKPPVRKLARDLGVDLAQVEGTGPGGSVTREDVQSLAEGGAQRQEAVEQPVDEQPAAGTPQASGRETRVPVKGVRKRTAQAMVASAFTAPHVSEFVTIDVTPMMELLGRLKAMPELDGVKVSPLLLVAKALLLSVRRHPEVNSSWDDDAQEIVVKHYVNLGIAAATPRGLVVPNIKDAHAMSLVELARSLQELTETAKAGRTSPADMAGGTITITNVGVFGVDTGTPIINPGESAILCFGAVREMPWVVDGQVVARQVTQLALSFDHRNVDGALGSMVLADVGRALSDPMKLLAWS